MPTTTSVVRQTCRACYRSFTSWLRLQHHWAAEHSPKTSQDVLRTSTHVAKTRDLPRGHSIPPLTSPFGPASLRQMPVSSEGGQRP